MTFRRFVLLTIAMFAALWLTSTSTLTQSPFFTSSWETALGCSQNSLSDGGLWNVENFASYCVAQPKIEVIGTDAIDGTRSIRKHQYPGDIGDGGGFETIIQKDFTTPLAEYWSRHYVKYEGTYWWQADMKAIITGGGDHTQDIYYETRPYFACDGSGQDNHKGRIALHAITNGTLWESANVQFVSGVWYLMEGHYRASSNSSTSNGTFEARVNGVPVTWCGSPSTSIRTGFPTWTYLKWSTYTNGSGDSTFQAQMPLSFLFDGFQMCTGTWCGGTGGGGGDLTPPSVTITQPTNQPTFATQTTPLTTLAGTCSDNVAVSSVTWSNNLGGSGTATGTTSWSVPLINLAVGVNVITVTCTDSSSNTAQDTLTVTYSLAAQLPPGRARLRIRR